MFRWLRVLFRLLFQGVFRLVKYILLITFPLYILSLTAGLIDGFFFFACAKGARTGVLRQFEINLSEVNNRICSLAQELGDRADEPFYNMELFNPVLWFDGLGLKDFYLEDLPVLTMFKDEYRFILAAADLEHLYRQVNESETRGSWHHWVYASSLAWSPVSTSSNVWDQAFDELLRYHYSNPPRANATFHHISCRTSYLCDAWGVTSPALIHFTTEDADVFPPKEGTRKRKHRAGFEPVTVRVIRFPIDNNKFTLPLQPGDFPSPFNQLRSITADPYAWQLYQPYLRTREWYRAFEEFCELEGGTNAMSYGKRVADMQVSWLGILGVSDDSGFWKQAPRWLGILVYGLAMQLLRIVAALISWIFSDRGNDPNEAAEPLMLGGDISPEVLAVIQHMRMGEFFNILRIRQKRETLCPNFDIKILYDIITNT